LHGDGTRQSEQGLLWVATAELPKSPGHPFYTRLNALLDADDFDGFVEGLSLLKTPKTLKSLKFWAGST